MSWERATLPAAALVSTRHEYDHLFSIYVPIAIGVFAVIVLAVVIAVVVFGRRPPERAARYRGRRARDADRV